MGHTEVPGKTNMQYMHKLFPLFLMKTFHANFQLHVRPNVYDCTNINYKTCIN